MKNSVVSVGGMIQLDFDLKNEMAQLEKRLGSFDKKAPNAMKYAINAAARTARKENAKVAKKRYVVRDKGTLNAAKLMKPAGGKWATVSNPSVTLRTFSDGMGKLVEHEVWPGYRAITGWRPDMYEGRVLKNSSLTGLTASRAENKGKPANTNDKAFGVLFKSGHFALVYRVLNKQARNRPGPLNKHTQAIEETAAPSLMSMSARSFKEPSVQENMFEAMEAELDKRVLSILKGG